MGKTNNVIFFNIELCFKTVDVVNPLYGKKKRDL